MSKLKKRKISSPPVRTSSRPSAGTKGGTKAARTLLGRPASSEITSLPTQNERVAAAGLLDMGSSFQLPPFPRANPQNPQPPTPPSLKVISAKGATLRTSQHIDSSTVICRIPKNEHVKLLDKVWMDPDDSDVVGIYRLKVDWNGKQGWISDRGRLKDGPYQIVE
ncbi:hypothetical protein TrLO_g11229 [Triparma laevis f. longispina]|uniref:SH3 domain-containing protein n=1 Tax=Triparma laevis f. longispina TaxID=1714387 RepID=A0A9W7FJJ4_9STRA|nr:hypothetical protein TrLO_g11229 [Triparma laevis f. longispina]